VRGLCLPLRACSCCCARVSPVSPRVRVPVCHTWSMPLPLRACSCCCARVSPVSPRVPVFHTKHRPVYACRCVLARVVARAYLPYLPVFSSLLLCTNLRPSRSFTPNTAPASSLTRALLFSNSVFVLLL
jgi:hypothetical protein